MVLFGWMGQRAPRSARNRSSRKLPPCLPLHSTPREVPWQCMCGKVEPRVEGQHSAACTAAPVQDFKCSELEDTERTHPAACLGVCLWSHRYSPLHHAAAGPGDVCPVDAAFCQGPHNFHVCCAIAAAVTLALGRLFDDRSCCHRRRWLL